LISIPVAIPTYAARKERDTSVSQAAGFALEAKKGASDVRHQIKPAVVAPREEHSDSGG
jgi:hypothetical protein